MRWSRTKGSNPTLQSERRCRLVLRRTRTERRNWHPSENCWRMVEWYRKWRCESQVRRQTWHWQYWPTSKDHALKRMVGSAVTLDGDSAMSSVALPDCFLVLLWVDTGRTRAKTPGTEPMETESNGRWGLAIDRREARDLQRRQW